MELLTQRKLIQGVAAKWEECYRDYPAEHSFIEIAKQLKALNGDTATPEDVNNIIGNASWTAMKCDECKELAEAVVRLGEEPDYESHTAHICLKCLQEALNLLNDEIARQFAASNGEANQLRETAYGTIPPTSSETP